MRNRKGRLGGSIVQKPRSYMKRTGLQMSKFKLYSYIQCEDLPSGVTLSNLITIETNTAKSVNRRGTLRMVLSAVNRAATPEAAHERDVWIKRDLSGVSTR